MSASSAVRATAAPQLTLKHLRWVGGHADVWAVFREPEALRAVVAALAASFREEDITAVCGVESRGFLLGAAVAVELGVGFVPVRKGIGMLPGEKAFGQTQPDYRGLRHTLRMQRGTVGEGDRVLLVDDWLETGNQAATVKEMVVQCGGVWAGCSVVVDQLSAERRALIGPVRAVLSAAELPADPPAPAALEALVAPKAPAIPGIPRPAELPSGSAPGQDAPAAH